MAEVDYDGMSDEDFMDAIESAASGETEQEEIDPADAGSEDTTEEETIEDTDPREDSAEDDIEDDETNEIDDDQSDDTETEIDDDEEYLEEENTQPDEDNESEEDDVDANTDSETEDETETDGEEPEAEDINYQEEYAKLIESNAILQGFKDEVTSEFIANGKKMKGFDDPKKIIQSMQMAAGFSDKMAGFKPYRPFMSTLKEKGMLDDPEKFNLAMSLLDGDSEALKQHLKNLEIDPFEMDMDNINYQKKNQVSSNIEIAYDDIMENAKRSNVGDQVQKIISKDWDDQSVIELLEDTQSSADLVHHINSGAYEMVQERIAEKKRTDVDNVYSTQSSIKQYREAAGELEAEYANFIQNQPDANEDAGNEQGIDQSTVETEKAKIEETRKATEYRKKVEKQNAKASEARKKATSVSKKKPRAKPKKKVIDPGELSDEEFTKYLDGVLYDS